MKRITAEDIAVALMQVKKGQDVRKLSDAKLYVDLEKLGLVECSQARGQEVALTAKPKFLFHAKTTRLGLEVLRMFEAWSLDESIEATSGRGAYLLKENPKP